MATIAFASVLTAEVAATDPTTAKTMSNNSNITGFAISYVFDVSDASAAKNTVTAYSLLRNRYCS